MAKNIWASQNRLDGLKKWGGGHKLGDLQWWMMNLGGVEEGVSITIIHCMKASKN